MLAKVLPNVITIGNLFFGLLALKLVHDGLWEFAAITVIAGMLCDGLDGIVARMLKTESAFGKELDSLSDMVTFGVAPAFIMYVAVLHEIGVIGWVVSVVFPVCGALRLARFNVRKGIPGYFVGLPITIAGGVLATMALYSEVMTSPSVLVLAMLGLSFLMVSSIKYPNVKKVGLPKQTYWLGPALGVVAVVLAVRFPNDLPRIVFLPLILYALWGLGGHFRRKGYEDFPLESDVHL